MLYKILGECTNNELNVGDNEDVLSEPPESGSHMDGYGSCGSECPL